jgi:glutamate-1-semialdehyde 2,1-aminomutase
MTESKPDSAGVPSGYAEYTLLADYNDLGSVEKLFDEYKDKIAAVVVEPVAANMGVVPPLPGFLEGLRKITEENDALLIFDEVITGFRLAAGGAQQLYGVQADITTLGKIIGGGMPVGAYGGRKEIMDKVAPTGSVYQAGTLSGNPVAMTAGLVTLKTLKENPAIYDRLEAKGAKLEAAYKAKFGERACVNRVGSIMSAFFTPEKVIDYDTAVTSDTEAFGRYFRYMLENGIYIAPSQFEAMFLSDALTDDDVTRTIEVLNGYEA